jgi:hypothetical protein
MVLAGHDHGMGSGSAVEAEDDDVAAAIAEANAYCDAAAIRDLVDLARHLDEQSQVETSLAYRDLSHPLGLSLKSAE